MERNLRLALLWVLLLALASYPAFAETDGLVIEDLEVEAADGLSSDELDADGLLDLDGALLDGLLADDDPEQAQPDEEDPDSSSGVQANATTNYVLNASSIKIGVKEKYTKLKVTTATDNANDDDMPKVTWRSANKKIAKVNSRTGKITGVKKGTTTIYAKIDGYKEIKCKVKVLKSPKKKNFSISPENGSLRVGQTGEYKITFDKGYGGSFTFSSSDPDVATIDENGLVTAISAGTCDISVTMYNGAARTVTLEVLGRGSSQSEKIDKLLSYARSKLGNPYKQGATGPNKFDCVGFTYWCYKQVGVKLKGTPVKQANDTRFMEVDLDELQPGDLVYFHTDDSSKVSHAALYLGYGEIIHASYTAGEVIISQMHSSKSDYYERNFHCARRVFP